MNRQRIKVLSYNIKDLKRAIEYMETKLTAVQVNLEQDDLGRLKFGAHDISKNHVEITVYKNNEDGEGTKMPEITKTERL